MALTESEIQAVGKAVQDVARSLKSAKVILDQTRASNTTLAINFGSVQATDALEDNVANPTPYTASDVSNALGSMALFVSGFWATDGQNMELMLGETPIV